MDDPATISISMPRVHTLQVTVRTLRIGSKQVTQSVFRQLPRRSVWDTMTGMLRGQPWGTVNYFWGDCTENHLHVVWQEGERLFRDCVYEPSRTRPEGIWRLEQRIEDLEQTLHRGALFILALKFFLQGWSLEELTPLKHYQIVWPCGVKNTLATPTQLNGQSDLGQALYSMLQMRKAHSVNYRPHKHEDSDAIRKPQGEGWVEHVPHQGYTPSHHWSRYREETQEEYVERREAELTNVYDALQSALATEAKAVWDLDPLPQDLGTAKEAIDPYAENWQIASAELGRLSQQFRTVYEQLTDLDQLFIAV